MSSLHSDERGNLPCLVDPLDVGGRGCQLERFRILPHHAMDDVDLLERGRDRGLSLQRHRHVHRPELPADATGLQAGDVGHDRGLRLRDVQRVEVARWILLAERPRVVIVAVDEERLLVDRAGTREVIRLGRGCRHRDHHQRGDAEESNHAQ
jgi:hypothetical protein